MKTLVKEGFSTELLTDDIVVKILVDKVEIGKPVETVLLTHNVGNCVLYTNVTAPDDWAYSKYLFNGAEWTLNPDWTEPEPYVDEAMLLMQERGEI